MIHPDDVAAWIAQVRQQPEAAPGIVEKLAARLIELDRQNEALRDELLRLRRDREAPLNGEQVAKLAQRVQTLERQLERSAQVEPGVVARSLLVLTLDGRGARLPLPDAETWKGRDDKGLVPTHLRPRHLLVAADVARLLLLSDKGRATRLSVADVDASEPPVNYVALLPGLTLDLDESVSVVTPLPSDFAQMTLITRKGYARSFRRAEVDSLLERGLPLHSSPMEGDYPAFAVFGDGKGELLIVTRGGKGVRFPERAVGVQAQPAIKMERGDVVAGAVLVEDATRVALVGAEGSAARREMEGFSARPSAGHTGKFVTRIENLIGVAAVTRKDTLWLLTAAGRLLAVPTTRTPSGPGASSGRVIAKLDKDQLVALSVSQGA